MSLDLTPFGFTPTESLIYGILVTKGPGTGYAVARSAGLARANAYAALEGLVGKGAARKEDGRPMRYRPEPPPIVLGRVVDRQSRAVDSLADAFRAMSVPATPTLTEVSSLRGATQLLLLEIARAHERVDAILPAESWPSLAPALRRADGSGVKLGLHADGPVTGAVVEITPIEVAGRWPGRPVLAVVDGRIGLLGSVEGDRMTAYVGTSPVLVAAVTLAIEGLAGRA